MPQSSEKREQAPALQENPACDPTSRDGRSSQPIKLRNWPHSPAHRLQDPGTYIVTAGTYKHAPIFRGRERLTRLTNHILELAERYRWSLQAWAVFPNHYHFVGTSQAPESLRSFLRHLHSITAIEANKLDETLGRQVWFEFWETRITFPRSYLSRLNYVLRTPFATDWFGSPRNIHGVPPGGSRERQLALSIRQSAASEPTSWTSPTTLWSKGTRRPPWSAGARSRFSYGRGQLRTLSLCPKTTLPFQELSYSKPA